MEKVVEIKINKKKIKGKTSGFVCGEGNKIRS